MQETFWALQTAYITQVFLPIIIGILLFSAGLVVLFAFGLYRRWVLWRLGQPENRSDRMWDRAVSVVWVALGNSTILREPYPGIMHFLIMWGFVLLFLGKGVRLLSYLVGITVPPHTAFLLASGVSEVGSLMILAGGVMAVFRRYLVRPDRLDNIADDRLVYVWCAVLILTGYLVKGYRIASAGPANNVDWWLWSPVSQIFAYILPIFTLPFNNEVLLWHRTLFHATPAFILFVYVFVARSRLQHVLLSTLNVLFRSLRPKGELTPMDLEAAETFGASKIEDFTWKQLLDLDACTKCGRCQDNCPAYLTGKALSPKKVIQDLKEHLYQIYPIPAFPRPAEARRDMITEAITEEVLWDCITCRACQEACPIYIEHIQKIVDMRRYLSLELAEFPDTVATAMTSLMDRAHPWRGTIFTRRSWTQELDVPVPTLAEKEGAEYLLWIGCTGALVSRNQSVARATARLLHRAGIDFAILGDQEVCCGDPARRWGNEYLYQTLAQRNIQSMKSYGVKKIVATCPHCYNTLKYEYPAFGGDFEVVHHSELLNQLYEGQMSLASFDAAVTYHDPCYLGRYSDVYDPPRRLLISVPSLDLREMGRNRRQSFCCGGGGGRAWEEESVGERINQVRALEASETKAGVLAVACPFCLQMMEDGVLGRNLGDQLRVMDIAEILAAALERAPR